MCTMHDTIETHTLSNGNVIEVYPYQCARCEYCFLCGHKLIGYRYWVCNDGVRIPTKFNSGVVK